MNTRTLRIALIGMATLAPLAAAAEDYGGCIRVDLATPFVLPDGSVHEPGTLTLCTDRPLNPVAGMHRMSASGTGVGRVVSRRVRSEFGALEAPQVVFAREPDGSLRLLGYVEPAGGRVRAFRFGSVGATAVLRPSGRPDEIVLAAR